MRKPITTRAVAACLAALLWTATAAAQESDLNRVADGDFEVGVSLSLPAAAQFPMFSGGWASRGALLPETARDRPFEGEASLRLRTTPEAPSQVLQDIPIDSPAYGLRFAFMVEEGRQTVRLLSTWDRGAPAGGTAAFEARLSASAIVFTTPAGSWRIDTELAPGTWHALSVIADPRSGGQNVRLDGQPLINLPGVARRRPSTIILAGGAGDEGVFRYDAVELISLVDLELNTIRDAVARIDSPARAAILDRLAAAGMALRRGSEPLALPELAVARNMLGSSELAAENLRLALAELIELIEAGDGRAERRRDSPFPQF
jgi:hypothetical protein